ncbi:UvrD-helicase domain-containing protein [Conchiformibius steedae DSM 2580]|uniref:ATP-dependent DNA helicase Rep n=1 Tax=Conchiformibius steedae DSM 2580 TaxID=1121352 RepID=A0AAE9HWG5_9NEIS|nr:UvrD-helicase domain-containing protein [Conchiformibius steedae]QMT32896.1 UvrD-helicase domain-containing protein [Conchiformibius steedae]URD67515.1 UvrD-helicase domain-containing protein [Conchiformibius steedae DSM 2580]
MLNPQQREAVHYLGGPLFVLAGAGSGKTRVITEKIAYLLTQAGYAPHSVAAITFTNKAAAEMRERINALLGAQQTKGLTVSTFHAFGMRLLREEATHLGYQKDFSVFDASDSGKIIAELLEDNKRDSIFRTQQQISLWKNALLSPEQAALAARDDWQAQTAQIYVEYQDTLCRYQAVDFDDLIVLPTLLLKQNNDLRLKWQRRLRYLLVDECQDTNTCQYLLMRLLCGAEGRFTVVGDDDQSIYAWRGADMENLKRLQQDYPQLKIIKLEQNYRSSARILRVANGLIANNPKLFAKTLWSQLGEGDAVRVVACQNEEHEADYVARQIVLYKLTRGEKGRYADCAVLYRSNHQARLFEEALRAARIPYRVSGGQSFFDKTEIKDILAYLRLLANPNDNPAFLRAATTPKCGIGATTLGKLNLYAAQHQVSLLTAAQQFETSMADAPVKSREAVARFAKLMARYRQRAENEAAGDVIHALLADIGYHDYLIQHAETSRAAESRWRNVGDLADWLARKGTEDDKNLIELAQTIALMTLLEGKNEEETDAVRLSTLHASKGLEYENVFLAGCEEGLFPHADSIDEGRTDEERRLMYVGITRAKQQLTLLHCIKRKYRGEWSFPEPSRFIGELPQHELQIFGRKGSEPVISKAEGRARLGGMLAVLNQKIADKQSK